jgi:hypothetical protein
MKKTWQYYLTAVIQGALLAVASPLARGEDATGGYVSRKEYEELKAEMLEMKKELASLKKEKRAESSQESNQESAKDQAAADLHKDVAAPTPEPEEPVPVPTGLGTTKFDIAGWGEGMFEARNGSVSTFSASVNPIFLWELSPKILFESRLEIEPSGGGTNVNLVYAQLTYLLNDYITLGAGEFFAPSNVFVERFEPQWIQASARQNLRLRWCFAPHLDWFRSAQPFYIGQRARTMPFMFPTGHSPRLRCQPAGKLRFNDFTDNSDNKAVGGSWFFLRRESKSGMALKRRGLGSGTTFGHVNAFLQSVDLNVTRLRFLKVASIAPVHLERVDPPSMTPMGRSGFWSAFVQRANAMGVARRSRAALKVDLICQNFKMILRWDQLHHAAGVLVQ